MSDPHDRLLAGDVLAGIVGLFGGLTREELRAACTELAYKTGGEDLSEPTIDAAIDEAVADWHLYAVSDADLLIPGPAAFPELPTYAEDLPHLMDVEARSIDREAAARDLVTSLADEMEDDPDADRHAEIEQLSYDIESWADVDASALRS